jgi:hypothetical protein
MRWLIALAPIGAVALLVLKVTSHHDFGGVHLRGTSRRTSRGTSRGPIGMARLIWTTLSLVVVAGGVFLAHWLGIFSVPLVALAFVPFGIALRWWLTANRASRERDAQIRAEAHGRHLPAAAELPVFVFLAAIAIAAGLAVGIMVGPH